MTDAGDGLATDEFADYCRTQARLLAGRVEEISDEVATLLDEVDEDITEARERIEGTVDPAGTISPASTDGPEEDALADIERLGEELESKQAVVEAEQARLAAHQELAADYADLAGELSGADLAASEALSRVAEFEADADAPAYFPDRQTVVEAAAESADDGDDGD